MCRRARRAIDGWETSSKWHLSLASGGYSRPTKKCTRSSLGPSRMHCQYGPGNVSLAEMFRGRARFHRFSLGFESGFSWNGWPLRTNGFREGESSAGRIPAVSKAGWEATAGDVTQTGVGLYRADMGRYDDHASSCGVRRAAVASRGSRRSFPVPPPSKRMQRGD